MSFNFFEHQGKVEAHAFHVGQRINLKALRSVPRLAEAPVVIEAGDQGCAVLFRYGVVVLFGLKGMEQVAFLSMLEPHIIDPFPQAETEATDIVIKGTDQDAVHYDAIRIREWDMDRIQVIADILAKSLALTYHETQTADTFDRIEPIASEMQKKGHLSSRRWRDLLKHIGTTLAVQRKMAGQVEIDDKPELLWEAPPELNRLYARLEDEYELKERHNALKEKLELIYRTAEMMMGVMQDRRTLHVEWYIVFLILLEIVLTLSEKLHLW